MRSYQPHGELDDYRQAECRKENNWVAQAIARARHVAQVVFRGGAVERPFLAALVSLSGLAVCPVSTACGRSRWFAIWNFRALVSLAPLSVRVRSNDRQGSRPTARHE
jgi:hypothetical protein